MTDWKSRLVSGLNVAVRDVVGLAGAAAVVTGSAMIYAPAGWIVGGVFALAYALLTAKADG